MDKRAIFLDERDRLEFVERFRNYLTPERTCDSWGRAYAKLHDRVCLLGFNLMGNHYHLIAHQEAETGVSELMHRATTSFSRYVNSRHGRCGPAFRGRHTAKPIWTIEHARAAIAYVHLNDPIAQLDHRFSSHRLYSGERTCDWIDVERGLAVFGGYDGYRRYMNLQGPAIVERKLTESGLPTTAHPYRPI